MSSGEWICVGVMSAAMVGLAIDIAIVLVARQLRMHVDLHVPEAAELAETLRELNDVAAEMQPANPGPVTAPVEPPAAAPHSLLEPSTETVLINGKPVKVCFLKVKTGDELPHQCLCASCSIGVHREIEFCDTHYPLVSPDTIDTLGHLLTLPAAQRELMAAQIQHLTLLAVAEVNAKVAKAPWN